MNTNLNNQNVFLYIFLKINSTIIKALLFLPFFENKAEIDLRDYSDIGKSEDKENTLISSCHMDNASREELLLSAL